MSSPSPQLVVLRRVLLTGASPAPDIEEDERDQQFHEDSGDRTAKTLLFAAPSPSRLFEYEGDDLV